MLPLETDRFVRRLLLPRSKRTIVGSLLLVAAFGSTVWASTESGGEGVAQTPRRRGPLQGFVLPSMRAIGLFSERIAGHFEEMFEHNHSSGSGGFKMQLAEMPEDLEAWVLESELS